MNNIPSTLPVGYRLRHYYRIESILDAGIFGITYKAIDETWRQTQVAIKEYFPVEWSYRDRDEVNVLANTQGALPTWEEGEAVCYTWGLERFLNEARILARVNHPGVVRVRDFFEANGTAYIVMDYEDGEPLSQILQREKTLSEDWIRRLLKDVLPALDAVHAQGYLHRDLKPANLYHHSDGRTILIDFGAARQALGRRSKSVTSVFSPGYSPIEQYLIDGKGYGPWTDIYALGAVLYHCVTGVAPIEAPVRVLDDPLKPAETVAAGRYSPALLRLVDRAMAVRPEKRFQSIAKMQEALTAPDEDEGDRTVTFQPSPYLRRRRGLERGEPLNLPPSPPAPLPQAGERGERLQRLHLSLPDWYQALKEELDRLPLGMIMFNPPSQMKLGTTERVEVRITQDPGQDLVHALKGRGFPQIEVVRVGSLMKARLSGEAFSIKALNDDAQIISPKGYTEWAWEVSPLKSGIQKLYLHVTVRIRLPYGEENKDHPVMDRKIYVEVNSIYSMKKFITHHWQWIIGALIIPLIGLDFGHFWFPGRL